MHVLTATIPLAAVAALALAGCSSGAELPYNVSGGDNQGSSTSSASPVENPDAGHVSSSAAEETESPDGYVEKFTSINVDNPEGYTGILSGQVIMPYFEVAYENAKPGYVDLMRPNLKFDMKFKNTTSNREAPSVGTLDIALYYSAESGACQFYNQEADNGTSGNAKLGSQYCFVPVLGLADGPNGLPQHFVEPSSENPYSVNGLMGGGSLEGLIEEVPEEQAQAALEAVNSPLGMVLSYGAPEEIVYKSGLNCPALPAPVTSPFINEPLMFPRTVVGGQEVSILATTGPIC